jgi:predicted ATP-dependent endonuclease of OLD family
VQNFYDGASMPLEDLLLHQSKLSQIMRGISIENYRGFSSLRTQVPADSRFNIIIGLNNSGKSNIIRILQRVFSAVNNINYENYGNDLYMDENGVTTEVTPVFGIMFYLKDLISSKLLSATKMIDIEKMNVFDPTKMDYKSNPEYPLWLYFRVAKNKLIPHEPLLSEFVSDNLLSIVDTNTDNKLGTPAESFNSYCYDTIIDLISKQDFIYISEIRDIHKSESDNKSVIAKEIHPWQHPSVGNEKFNIKFNRIVKVLKKLLDQDDLSLEVSPDYDIILRINKRRMSLKNYGTGIHQVVMIALNSVVYDDAIICIEEPENNLHPTLQRNLMILLQEQTNNKYFITSHSNVIMNSLNNSNILHVYNDNITTKIKNISNIGDISDIVRELGYRASDILQSNGIIWVEGPSDRVYINKWLSLISDNKFREGIEYSIMFYGGRLLSHLTLIEYLNSDNFINLIKINKNAIVVIDSDRKEQEDAINKTKKRISSEVSDKGFVWITKGKEIENYINHKDINAFLIRNKEDCRVEYGQYVDVVSKLKRKMESKKYLSSKVLLAEQLVKHFDNSSLNVLDLKSKMSKVMRIVSQWNS